MGTLFLAQDTGVKILRRNKDKVKPIGWNAGYDATGNQQHYNFLGLDKEKTAMKEEAERLFKRIDQIDAAQDGYMKAMDSLQVSIKDNQNKLDDKANKIDYELKFIDWNLKAIDALNDWYNKSIAASKESKHVSITEQAEKKGLEYANAINLSELKIESLEAENLQYEKRVEQLNNEYDKYETAYDNHIAELEQIEERLDYLADQKKSVKRKINRLGRQAARKEKRENKRKMKAELKAQGLKGKAYRQAKRAEKAKLKDIKAEQIKKYGGTFGRRMWQGTKAIGLAVPRNAFLLLVKLNVFNLAKGLNYAKQNDKVRWEKVKDKWGRNFAGDIGQLEKEIERGKDKKAILKLSKNDKYDATGTIYYNLTGAEAMAALVEAAPILGTIAEVMAGVAGVVALVIPRESDPNIPKDDKEREERIAYYTGIINGLKVDASVKAKLIELLNSGGDVVKAMEDWGIMPYDEAKLKANGIDPDAVGDSSDTGGMTWLYWTMGGIGALLLIWGVVELTKKSK